MNDTEIFQFRLSVLRMPDEPMSRAGIAAYELVMEGPRWPELADQAAVTASEVPA